MNRELSGGTNGIVYERVDAPQTQPGRSGESPAAGAVRANPTGGNLAVRRPEPMIFSRADVLLAFGMIVCGFLYWNLIDPSLGLGVTLFTAVLCAAVLFYFNAAGYG